MTTDDISTFSANGLRYKSKQGGSPFGESSSPSVTSCFKCGLNKARSLGSFRKLLGGSMFVCGDCKPVQKQSPHAAKAEYSDLVF